VLTSAGAASFLGPTLLSSTDTLTSTTQTVKTGSMVTGTSVTTTEYIGPQTINIGDYGVCQSYPPPTGCTIGGTPFFIPAGGQDTDTFFLTLVDIFTTTTTTNTDLLTQVYNLVGVPGATAMPEPPPAWTLLGAGLRPRLHLPATDRRRACFETHPLS
jgi:hypothetical protein